MLATRSNGIPAFQIITCLLPTILIPLAESKNCKYEIIQYEKKPIFGTQFHPEMSQDGNDLIEKFCLL